MKRPILNALDAAWLSTTVDRNRRLFGGLRMMAEDTGDKGDQGDQKSDAKPDDKSGDKPDAKPGDKGDDDKLGEGGKKAIEAERDARKAAEAEMKSLKGEFESFKTGLTEALGIKPKEGDKDGDALTAVQEQLAAMQRESAVLKLANEHKITDEKDLELLATAKDEDSMKKLAERLAPGEQDSDATSRTSKTKPKPTRSQGGSSEGAGGKSVREVMEERRAARAAKQQQSQPTS